MSDELWDKLHWQPSELKRCSICKAKKDRVNDFHNDKASWDGKTATCKPCKKLEDSTRDTRRPRKGMK